MFTGGFKESSANQVEINDMSREIFKEFINFLYTGNTSFAENQVLGLLEAADFYQVEDLRAVCELRLLKELTLSNADEIFQYSHRFNCSDDFKRATFNFVQQ